MAVPKRWLEKTGGFDENFKGWGLEDVEVGYALYKAGLKIIINSKLEVFHQNHPESDNLQINKNKYEQIDRNTRCFLEKHPGAIAEPETVIYRYYAGTAGTYCLVSHLRFFHQNLYTQFQGESGTREFKEKYYPVIRTEEYPAYC